MKGHTKACPACRKIVLRYCNFKGEGSFETRCPHCKETVLVKLELEPCITVEKVVRIILMIILPIAFILTTLSTHLVIREIKNNLASLPDYDIIEAR